MQTKKRKERFLLRVIKGGFAPENSYVASRLRDKGYKVGDVVLASITKPRKPGYNKYAHKIAQLCIKNTERFSQYTNPHLVLKTLQAESGAGCEIIILKVPQVGFVEQRIPLSLSFESMEQGEFEEVVKGLCRHIGAEYMHGMTPEQVQEMVEVMPDEI